MRDVKRVAICITALDLGGAETMLLELLKHRPEGVEFRVFSLMSGGALRQAVEETGVPVTGLGMKRGIPSIRAILELTRLLRDFAPDVVHTWMYHSDLIGGLAARNAGVPRVLWHIHNADLPRERSKWTTRAVVALLARLSGRVPDAILCCAEAAKADHLARGYCAEKLIVVPNGVDVDRFVPDASLRAEVRGELGIGPDEPLLGRVASWDPQKDWPSLVKAIGRFVRDGQPGRFLLVGREIESSNPCLAELLAAEGVSERAILAGLRTDVPRLLPALDIFTSASLGEAFPVSIVEAMSCEVPCVVTDAGDSAVIVGETGRVVPRGDADALALAWEELVQLPAAERERFGRMARTRARERYAITDIAERIWALYEGSA